MECPRCCRKEKDIDIPSIFSSVFVLKNHQAFHAGVSSLLTKKKELIFFENDHPKKLKFNRPVLLQAITDPCIHVGLCDDYRRSSISLAKMKLNHIHQNQQLSLWIVTQPEPTNSLDGTIYFVVRDQNDFHIRLIISNWSYVMPMNELKTREESIEILNELLPIDSMIKLYDPLLTKCHIDGQYSLRCDSPNVELILFDRKQKYSVDAQLDEVRKRGNQAYIRGHLQLAVDYYTFAINQIAVMAKIVISKDDECEMDLFQGAFQNDLSRLHSNRSACYLREGFYPGAGFDAFTVVTSRLFSQTYDDFFLKCLYRLTCATISLQDFTLRLDGCFILAQNPSINFNLRMKYAEEFNRIQSNLPRLKDESKKGKYDLKQMFSKPSINSTSLFDIDSFHCDYNNDSCIKKRGNRLFAKCSIPAGTLLVVQHAFAFVQSIDENADRRLINEIEKRLIMTPTVWTFDEIRMMPLINHWFENEPDADEDYPKSLPWGLLVKTQEQNPFRSKSLVGWWPKVSTFKLANDSNQKANCLWFICGKTIFLFTFTSLNKNDEFLIAKHSEIRSFLFENRKQFAFILGNNYKVQLDEIFDHLHQTQIYF